MTIQYKYPSVSLRTADGPHSASQVSKSSRASIVLDSLDLILNAETNGSNAAFFASLDRPVSVMHGTRSDAAAVKHALQAEYIHSCNQLEERLLEHMRRQALILQQDEDDT